MTTATQADPERRADSQTAEVRAVLLDVDDCVLPTDGSVSSAFYQGCAELADTLSSLAAKGAFVGFCTGRDRNYVEAVSFFTGLASLPSSWSVVESGIALFNPSTKELRLNEDLTPEVLKTFEAIRREKVPGILERFPQLFEYPGNQVQITFERRGGTKEPIEVFWQAVRDELQDLETRGLLKTRHSRIAVDISPVGRNGSPLDKGSGARFCAETTGAPLSHTLGIGDSAGDLPMMELTGLVGCPSNASEDCMRFVRSRQGWVSPLPYAAGVADVIRHFAQ